MPMVELDDFYGPNAGYVAELLERFERDPDSLDPATRQALAGWATAPIVQPTPPPAPAGAAAPAAAGAAALAQAIRLFGHLGAQLDPLGSPPPGDPQLDPATRGLTDDDLAHLPASVVGGPLARTAANAAEAIRQLRQIYCG